MVPAGALGGVLLVGLGTLASLFYVACWGGLAVGLSFFLVARSLGVHDVFVVEFLCERIVLLIVWRAVDMGNVGADFCGWRRYGGVSCCGDLVLLGAGKKLIGTLGGVGGVSGAFGGVSVVSFCRAGRGAGARRSVA